MICLAVDCQDPTIGESKHCLFHRNKFLPLYVKYKKLSNKLNLDIPLESCDIYLLLKLSSRCEKLYNMRSEYRKIAFRPEYHDHGHTRIIHSILNKLDDIRKELSRRFNSYNIIEKKEIEPALVEEIKVSITNVSKIQERVVIKHKEEWDDEAIRIYETNVKRNREIDFLIDAIFNRLGILYPEDKDVIIRLQGENIPNLVGIFMILRWLFIIKHSLDNKTVSEPYMKLVELNSGNYYTSSRECEVEILKNVYKCLLYREPKELMDRLPELTLSNREIISINTEIEKETGTIIPYIKYKLGAKLMDISLRLINDKYMFTLIDEGYKLYFQARMEVIEIFDPKESRRNLYKLSSLLK